MILWNILRVGAVYPLRPLDGRLRGLRLAQRSGSFSILPYRDNFS